MHALEFTIGALIALLGYAWVVFPVLLRWAAGRRPGLPIGGAPAGDNPLPALTVIISAFNEETVIADRVRNLLALDYPADKLRVLIGVDGATDRTADMARRAAAGDPRVEVMAFPVNRGKVAVLKDLAARARDRVQSSVFSLQILVFSDANTMFDPDALRRLVAPFSDASVGGVCGRLVLGAKPHPSPEGSYWRWETKLKTWESRLDSCLGANGAIYAIRAPLFPSGIPDNTIVDDFVIGMKVREAGGRFLYEPASVAREELPERADEWRRRVRIGAGDYQAIALCRACLHPRYGWFAWCFWSHKVLRWMTPHLILLLIACALWSFALNPSPQVTRPSAWGLAGAAGIGILAVAGRVFPSRVRIGLAAWHFIEMQAALFAGFLRFCRGNLRGRWDRTPR
jgi:cellulose synthase/poly-beta-1,6-N-acetylglucosamine synthase-like glycosyltransferase